MDYLVNHEDYLNLKMEQNSGHYLFNSLLAAEQSGPDRYIDDLFQGHCYPHKKDQSSEIQDGQNLQETIINQISCVFNIRTTPLSQLMVYVQKMHVPTEPCRRNLIKALKKLKFFLKREHAKKKTPITQITTSYQQIKEMIKTEEEGISPFLFQEESVETKKKKRNRMSAQTSRDKKKQYLRQIEKQNRELKLKLALINRKNLRHLNSTSRDFLKILLCLGITCFMNVNPSTKIGQQMLMDKQHLSTETILSQQGKCISKIDVNYYKGLMPVQKQQIISDFFQIINDNDPAIQTENAGGQSLRIKQQQSSDKQTLLGVLKPLKNQFQGFSSQ